MRKSGSRIKTLEFRRVVLGLLRELSAGTCESLPGRVEECMVYEDHLLQIQEYSRKADKQVIPTELLSSQLTASSYGCIALSYTCLFILYCYTIKAKCRKDFAFNKTHFCLV